MKYKLFFVIIYLFLFNDVLLSNKIDLKKYGKLTNINYYVVIMDSSDFKVDDEIYIKITGYFDYGNYIHYIFTDDLTHYASSEVSCMYCKEVSYNKIETVRTTRVGYKIETRYFTIEKSKINLDGAEGKYLLIYPNIMYG